MRSGTLFSKSAQLPCKLPCLSGACLWSCQEEPIESYQGLTELSSEGVLSELGTVDRLTASFVQCKEHCLAACFLLVYTRICVFSTDLIFTVFENWSPMRQNAKQSMTKRDSEGGWGEVSVRKVFAE